MEDLKFRRIVSSRHRVEFLAFSSSKRWGTLLGACFGDYSVRLYDCSGDEEAVLLACFTEHTSNVWGLCFSSDGSLLASCSSDKQLIVYSVDQVSVLKVLTLHSGTVWSCKFLSSQNLLASASEDCTVKITSVDTGDVSRTVSFSLPLESLDVSKKKELMCVSASRYGKVWILASPDSKTIEVYSSEVGLHAVQFIRDNKDTEYLAVSTQSHAILVFLVADVLVNVCNSPPAFVLEGHCNIIWRFCSISNECSTTIISASGDKTVRFWDLIARRCVHVLRYFQGSLDPNSQILACDLMQDGENNKKLCIGTYDGYIYISNLK